jgi:hypothetical protein
MTDDTKKQVSDKNIQSAKRRGALKSLGGSAAAIVAAQNLPDSWKKPLVDSIVLPAHAATTDDNDSDPGETPTTTPAAVTTTTAATSTMHVYPTTNKPRSG